MTTDSLLLADFVRLKPRSSVLELGCAAGLISLLLLHRAPDADVFAVELSGPAAEQAEANFAANGRAARVVHGDLRAPASLPAVNSCDAAVCNPPYFAVGSGAAAPDSARAAARSEGECTFADVCRAAARSLKQGGRFFFVHRSERLAGIFAALAAEKLEPKRLRFVQHAPGAAPGLVLCEAVRLGRPGLAVEPPLLLHDAEGRDSAEARRIYHMEG